MSWEERVRRHATEGWLACLVGFALSSFSPTGSGRPSGWTGPSSTPLSTSTDTFINHVAYVGFQVVNFRPAWVPPERSPS